jgi:hypothetical protein
MRDSIRLSPKVHILYNDTNQAQKSSNAMFCSSSNHCLTHLGRQAGSTGLHRALRTGVNVDELWGTIDAVKKAPVIAKFKFRANNQWIEGGHNRTTIKDFYGIQKDHRHEATFKLDADVPGRTFER